MFSAIGSILKPLMLFNGISDLSIKFNSDIRGIEIKYIDRAGNPISDVMPFASIEAQINGQGRELTESTPYHPPTPDRRS